MSQTVSPPVIDFDAELEARDNAKADDLVGERIGPWTVIAKRERHETRSGRRAVYVIQHRDGFIRGVRGYQLNRLMREAQKGGLA